MPRRIHAALTAAVAVLTVLTVAVLASSPSSLAPAAAAPSSGGRPAAYSKSAFGATNHQRVKHDRTKFRHQQCLHRFAKRQAARMAHQERMFHQDLGPVLRRCHLSYAGENVAEGYASGSAVVNRGWMRSSGHRANILDRRFQRMEVVARRGDDGRWYASQVFGRAA